MTDSKRETTISQNTKQMTMRVVSRVETKVCKRLHTNGRDENRSNLSEIEDLFVGRDCSLGIIFEIKPLLVTKCYQACSLELDGYKLAGVSCRCVFS